MTYVLWGAPDEIWLGSTCSEPRPLRRNKDILGKRPSCKRTKDCTGTRERNTGQISRLHKSRSLSTVRTRIGTLVSVLFRNRDRNVTGVDLPLSDRVSHPTHRTPRGSSSASPVSTESPSLDPDSVYPRSLSSVDSVVPPTHTHSHPLTRPSYSPQVLSEDGKRP